MDPVTLGLLISAGVGLAQTGINAYTTSRTNKKNIEAQASQFEKEKALSQENWDKMNMYNSPEQQMIRLKQAGLNPNLVYGKGADNTASAISNIQKNMPNQIAPQFDLSSVQNAFSNYYDIKAKQAQTENTREATSVMKANKIQVEANTAKTLEETARTKFDRELAQELRDNTVQKAKLENEMLTNTIQINMNRNNREELANTKNLELTTQKILTEQLTQLRQKQVWSNNALEQKRIQNQIDQINTAIDNAKIEGKIKSIELNLNREGLSMKDPIGFRVGVQQLNGEGRALQKAEDWYQSQDVQKAIKWLKGQPIDYGGAGGSWE